MNSTKVLRTNSTKVVHTNSTKVLPFFYHRSGIFFVALVAKPWVASQYHFNEKPHTITDDTDKIYIKTQVFRLLRYYSPAPRNIARSDWATQNITHNMTSSKT